MKSATPNDGGGAVVPLLPKLKPPPPERPASVVGAVFNVSTSIVGAGIMSIPATIKVLGVIPALVSIAMVAILVDVSVEFMMRFTNFGESSTYAGLMYESFGRFGSVAVQICILITNLGCLIIYQIIIGNTLKKMLVSADDAVLADIKTALQFIGRPNPQKQGRAAHILLRYAPSYATFSAADHIPIPKGEDHLIALIFSSFKHLKEIGLEASDSEQTEEQVADQIVKDPDQLGTEVDEAFNLAFEEAGLNLSDPPSTSGRGDVFEDIFTNLGDLSGTYPEDMAGESLQQIGRKKNAERMAARRRAEAVLSEAPPATVAESTPAMKAESTPTVIAEKTAHPKRAEMEEVG